MAQMNIWWSVGFPKGTRWHQQVKGKEWPPRRIRCTKIQRQKSQGPGSPVRSVQMGWDTQVQAWGEGVWGQGQNPPGGLHTRTGQSGASSLAAQYAACRSCRRGARLTVCGSGRFPGAHNLGDSLQRQWSWLLRWEPTAGRHPHSIVWPPTIEGELEAPHPVLLEGLNQS